MNIEIDLLKYSNNIITKVENGVKYFWDDIRKAHYILTPEETVRQLLIQYLTLEANYPKNKIAIEKKIMVLGNAKRFDVVVFEKNGNLPFMLIECKAPNVAISQETLSQVSAYNFSMKAPYLVVCNGLETHCYAINFEQHTYEQLAEFPNY